MNSEIEGAIQSHINAALPTLLVLCGTGKEALPSAEPCVVVYCSEVEGVVFPLSKATVEIRLRSPHHTGSVEDHRTLSATVRGLFAPPQGTALAAVFASNTSLSFLGFSQGNLEAEPDGLTWVSGLSITIGISEGA